MPVTSPCPVVLGCHGLTVSLGADPILFSVDAELRAGQTVALLGGNGSGKTTLIRALLGLIPHQEGAVTMFDTPAEKFHDWHRLGYVPQRVALQVQNASVGEVVSSGRLALRKPFRPTSRLDRAAVHEALHRVKLTNRLGSQFRTLSGGQQQRALIARALVGRPDLLVLDEPMAGLDVATQEGLAELFADLKDHGLSMLVVLHELGCMEPLIDRSIVLRAGRIIHDGPLRPGPVPNQGDHHDHDEPVVSLVEALDLDAANRRVP